MLTYDLFITRQSGTVHFEINFLGNKVFLETSWELPIFKLKLYWNTEAVLQV